MPPTKLLLSGSGSAGQAVARCAVRHDRAAIVGLCDPRSENLQAGAQLYPQAQTSAEYVELLDQVQPDAVVVAGPDHLHAEQALAALERGCHVLVEKPLATTVEDAQRIVAAQEGTGLHVMADHTMRYLHPWRAMALAAQQGDIGEVFFVQGDYIHDMWHHYDPAGRNHTPWRIDGQFPQNILLGGGCHPIDLMLWSVGQPVDEVFGYASKKSIPQFPDPDCYILVLRFANGVLGKVYVTSGCSGHGMGGGFLAAYGTDGSLWQGNLHRRDQETIELPEPPISAAESGHGWAGSVTDFLDLLEGRIDNPIPARHGARTVALCVAGLEAIKSGQPQRPVAF
ncbi:MAG: hypothetical protein GKR89_34010 [Candidatus Latescibacteria bacterium]|nr:hypothetical protein [Candidatus Latescibacterota bacterium]